MKNDDLITSLVKTIKRRNETDEVFHRRLVNHISQVPDEVWESLPIELQQWHNDTADAIENELDTPALPILPDSDEYQAQSEEPDEEVDVSDMVLLEDEDEDDADNIKTEAQLLTDALGEPSVIRPEVNTEPKKSKKGSKVAEVDQDEDFRPKSARPESPLATATRNNVQYTNVLKNAKSANYRIREILIEHRFSISDSAILDIMKSENYAVTKSTITTMRGDLRTSVKVLQDQKLLVKPLL